MFRPSDLPLAGTVYRDEHSRSKGVRLVRVISIEVVMGVQRVYVESFKSYKRSLIRLDTFRRCYSRHEAGDHLYMGGRS